MFSIRDVAKQNNLLLAYHRLLTNPESTYKNFFRDAYSAYGMAAERNITLLRSKIKAGYLPANTIRVFMPKANGLNRMYTLMSIEDQIVYQAYANVLAEALVANPKVRRRYKKACSVICIPMLIACSFIRNGKTPIKHILKLLLGHMKVDINISLHSTLPLAMTV